MKTTLLRPLFSPYLFLIALGLSQNSLAVFNGVVPGGAHPDFPSVVKLVNSDDKLCTGVYIAPTVLLTAAHCLVDDAKGGLLLHGTAHRSELVITKPGIVKELKDAKGLIPDDKIKYDLAVVFMPSSAPATSEASNEEPLLSVPMMVAGFGLTDPTKKTIDDKAAIRHVGYTDIAGRSDQKRYFRVSGSIEKVTTDGTNAVPLPGDSGGPLIDKATKKIVGVCSGTREDKAKKTVVGDYVSLFSTESVALLDTAAAKRPGEIPAAFIDALRPKAKVVLDPGAAPAAPTPGTIAPPTAGPLVGYRPKAKLQPDFLQLDARLAGEISKAMGQAVVPGLVHTDQETAEWRPDLRSALVGETNVDLNGDGLERARIGHSIDNGREIWLITQNNLRYLIAQQDGKQNLLVESLRHFVPVKNGVIYFDAEWMVHFRSLDKKQDIAYKVRAYTHNFNPKSGPSPIYLYDSANEKLALANWGFLPAGPVKDDVEQPDTFELSLIDCAVLSGDDANVQLSRSLTWPFFLRGNGLYQVDSAAKTLNFREIDWRAGKLAPPVETLALEGDYEVKQRNGEFSLVRNNPSGPPTPLLVGSDGRLVRQTGRTERFSSVTDRTDKALAGLPINPKVSDLLDVPRKAPLYSNARLNAALAKSLGGSKKTWAILVYEDGQRPDEAVAAFAQKLANGTLNVSPNLKFVERVWRVPGHTAFNTRNAEDMEETFRSLFEALENTRTVGYFADFPTKRAEAVDTVSNTLETFWHTFEACLTEGNCRILTTMQAGVYAELAKKSPKLISQAAIIEMPKLEADDRKKVAQVLRRSMEVEFNKVLSNGAFDAAIRFGSTSTKGKQSPEREEQLLRDIFEWAEENTPRSSEIAANSVEKYLNRERTGGIARKIDIEGLRKHLKAEMVGNHDVADRIAELLKPLGNGTHFGPKPLYFTLLGTPGVGKTFLSDLIADYLTGEESNLKIDFKEFKGFDGDASSKVFQKIKSAPNKLHVVTLDDVDRATFNDLDGIRGIFDNGFYAKGTDKEVQFTNVVVIITANWGEKLILNDSNFEGSDFMEKLRRDIVMDDSKPQADPNPRGKISNRVWRVLAGKMFPMKPFTDEQLLTLALKFCDKRSKNVAAVSNRTVSIHPMTLIKYVSQRKAETAGASDIQNALETDVYPVYEEALQKPGVTHVILVPNKGKIQVVTNLAPNFADWRKSYENAREVIKTKGTEWFMKNNATWFPDDFKKIVQEGAKK